MSSTAHIDINRTLQNLNDSEISEANAASISRFVDHCAAEGISEVRQVRLVSAWKTLLKTFAPDGFRMDGATEQELKSLIGDLHRSDYADSTKHTFKAAVKKFYRVTTDGHTHPEKVKFFSLSGGKSSTVSRDELFTQDELTRLYRSFRSVRDRAFTMVLYESAARPGELLSRNIGDFTSNEKGDFIFLEGSKGTPDRTNQLVRSGRVIREWLAQHPLGGELGDVTDPSAPLWVKTEQQECRHCGELPRYHDDTECSYEPNLRDRLQHASYYRRFKDACERAEIPENKTRPYNLRHTRLTEVATFMGYEPLNKFAGWVPGSSRAKVYVHLNNDDVNQAIREEYGLNTDSESEKSVVCAICGTQNEAGHTECRTCARPLSLEVETKTANKLEILERLNELEKEGVLDHLDELRAVENNRTESMSDQ